MKAYRWLAVALMLVVLAGCDWSQYGFDAGHGGWNPSEQTITPQNVGGFAVRWNGLGEMPVVANGLVFAVDQKNSDVLVARDASTGAVRWTRTPDATTGFGWPTVSGNTVYAIDTHVTFADGTTTVRAFDAATGADRWSAVVSGCSVTGGPTVSDGLLFMVDQQHHVCAIDATTGAKAWSMTVPGVPVNGTLVDWVAVAGGRVFTYGWTGGNGPMNDVLVYALDERSGLVVWSRVASGLFTSWGAPVVAGGRLYVPANTLSTFDPATGTPAWSVAGLGIENVAVTQDAVVTTGPGMVHRLDPTTGAVAWSRVEPNAFYTKPAIANGVVFLATAVVALDVSVCCTRMSAIELRSGGELFSMATEGAAGSDELILRGPIVSGGSVYIGGFANGLALRAVGT